MTSKSNTENMNTRMPASDQTNINTASGGTMHAAAAAVTTDIATTTDVIAETKQKFLEKLVQSKMKYTALLDMLKDARTQGNSYIHSTAEYKRAGSDNMVRISEQNLKQTCDEIEIVKHLLFYCNDEFTDE